jgi:hypothetical protein
MKGGSANVACPATYHDTGVMTSIIDRDLMVYQKDPGKNTVDLAKAMTEFNPD